MVEECHVVAMAADSWHPSLGAHLLTLCSALVQRTWAEEQRAQGPQGQEGSAQPTGAEALGRGEAEPFVSPAAHLRITV